MLSTRSASLGLRICQLDTLQSQLLANSCGFLLAKADLALKLIHMRPLRPHGSSQLTQLRLLLLASHALLLQQRLAVPERDQSLSATYHLPEQPQTQPKGQNQSRSKESSGHCDIAHSVSPSTCQLNGRLE